MPAPRYLWILIPAVVGAGTLGSVLAPTWFRSTSDPPAAKANAGSVDVPVAPNGPRVGEALTLLREQGGADVQRLVDSYRDWASDPKAAGARKLLLGKLFAEPNVPKKLSSVLAAIEADPTAPDQDPLWDYLAHQLSEVWRGETATSGMDLMFAETRPRARRALISSFVRLAESDRFRELTPNQGQKLTEYFIDMHKELAAGQKPEVERALRKVAGNDVVDILHGKGLGEDDHVLESERAYHASLSETQRALARSGAQPAPQPPAAGE